jgi:hypothetical protein
VGVSPWSDEEVREYAAHRGISALSGREPVTDWIVDDTGFPKQGDTSPGGDVGEFCDGVRALSFAYAVDVKRPTRVVIFARTAALKTEPMSVETAGGSSARAATGKWPGGRDVDAR